MIAFIDLNTGNIFNGDNYTFWFDGEQSVNIHYSKPICFITDISALTVSLDSPVFQLAQIDNAKPNININDHDYIDLDKLTKVGGENIKSFSSDGYEYNGLYIHLIYVVAHSLTAGEFRDTLTIAGTKFTIAADFYNGDEGLINNLINRGDDIPWEVEKAIYDTNIREEGVDNITLNRKFKELLMEYINILANKGSYKSLFNALAWFEYGDLVKLKEYWSHTEFGDKTIFNEKPLNSIISTKTNELLSSHHKTSYIGLQCALKKIKLNRSGEIVWDTVPTNTEFFLPEAIPEVENIIMKHTTQDMVLKMALLRNFFKTYFMPIHLDLMMSTVEDIVFTNTIKITQKGAVSRLDSFDNIYGCDLVCLKNNGFQIRTMGNPAHYMEKCEIYVYPDTPFGTQVSKEEYEDGNVGIIGVELDVRNDENNYEFATDETKDKLTPKEQDGLATYLSQRATKIGVILPFEATFKGISGDDGNDMINYSTLRINKDGEYHASTVGYFSNYVYENGEYKVKFSLFFDKPGEYDLIFNFLFVGGKSFVKKFKTTILDASNNTIKLYTVRRHNESDFNSLLDSTTNHPDGYNTVNGFGFSLFERGEPKMYRQFLAYSPLAVEKSIGLNDVIILNLSDCKSILYKKISDDDYTSLLTSYTESNSNQVIKLLDDWRISFATHYYWDIIDRYNYPLVQVGQDYKKSKYLIGIRKVFSRNSNTNGELHRINIKKNTATLCRSGVEVKEPYIIYQVDDHEENSQNNYLMVEFETPWVIGDIINGMQVYDIIDGKYIMKHVSGDNIFNIDAEWDGKLIYTSYKKTLVNINILKNNIPIKDEIIFEPNLLRKNSYEGDKINFKVLLNDNTYRYSESEERFFPLFHKLEPIKDNIITEDELVYIKPTLSRTLQTDEPTWTFTNTTEDIIMTPITYMMEEYAKALEVDTPKTSNIGIKNPFIGNYDLKILPGKGYYKIEMQYTLHKTQKKTTLKNALLVV